MTALNNRVLKNLKKGDAAIFANIVSAGFFNLAEDAIRQIRSVSDVHELRLFMEAVSRAMGFKHFALIHHDDLRTARPGLVDLKNYPAAVVERLFINNAYRRDPVIRGSLFSGGAFLWSDLHRFMTLSRPDRLSFEHGVREGLNEGITVPYIRLGARIGSCTFAGTREPDRAERYLGPAQMIGIFAFQAALRLFGDEPVLVLPPRLQPRPRDCVALVGQGLSNKEIARALSLAPRTVDGYLTNARRLFNAHDRDELVAAAILAGEVGIDEIGRRQPR